MSAFFHSVNASAELPVRHLPGAPLVARLLRRRNPRLDPASLSEDLKRDLGFADGRGRLPRDPLRD